MIEHAILSTLQRLASIFCTLNIQFEWFQGIKDYFIIGFNKIALFCTIDFYYENRTHIFYWIVSQKYLTLIDENRTMFSRKEKKQLEWRLVKVIYAIVFKLTPTKRIGLFSTLGTFLRLYFNESFIFFTEHGKWSEITQRCHKLAFEFVKCSRFVLCLKQRLINLFIFPNCDNVNCVFLTVLFSRKFVKFYTKKWVNSKSYA